MITGAAVLVLLGSGLLVAGLLTGVTAWYWGCIAACAGAAILIVLARRSLGGARDPGTAAGATGAGADAGVDDGADAGARSSARAAAPSGVSATAPVIGSPPPPAGREDDPAELPLEEVEVSDLLVIVDLTDEVLVVDEHPRYHLAGCAHVDGRETIPLPLDEARADGFTPCGTCRPDRALAERARDRRRGAEPPAG